MARQPWRRTLVLIALVALVTIAHGQEEPDDKTPAAEPEAGTDPAAEVETVPAEAAAEAAAAAAEEAVEEATAAEAVEEAVDEPAEALPPSAPAASGSKASVQWVVTQKMRAQLTKLGYSEAEIAKLDAERAAAIIRRSISRPQQGVPTGWNRKVRSRSAVGLGRSLLATVSKPFQQAPGGPLAASAVVLTSVASVVAVGLTRGGVSSKLVERVVALEPDEEVVSAPASDELWLDRQIDKLIAFLKAVFGK